MSAPKLSNLQFLVLGALRSGPRTGREIRTELERFDVNKSGPAFYQLMSRLEASGLVSGDYWITVTAAGDKSVVAFDTGGVLMRAAAV